jgi:DNA-binding NarL/FixJ family response regulator
LLTPREEQVVALVADGLTNREVATELGLTEHTVKKYLFRIFDKLGISSRVELVLYAVSNGDYRAAEWMAGQAVGN